MLTSIDVKFIFNSECTFRVVQLRKYSPNGRCHPSSCLLAVLAMFLAFIFLLLKRVNVGHFCFYNQNINIIG